MLGTDDEPESVDVAELQRQMAEALARGNALDPDEAAAFSERFNAAVRGQVDRAVPSEELRALLAGSDLQARFQAAAELSRRGLLPDDVGAQMISSLNAQVRAAGEAAADHADLDPARFPEGPVRDLAGKLQGEIRETEADLFGRSPSSLEQLNALVRQASRSHAEALITAPAGAPTETQEV